MLEVHIDVGRLLALGRDEALEQKIDLGRVHIGDGEAIANGGVGRRATPLAENANAARIADDVVDGEEVWRVVKLGDQRQLFAERIADLIGNPVGETPFSALPGQILKMGLWGLPLRHRLIGIFVFQLIEREAAGICDLDAALQRCLVAFEQTRHFVGRFQMPLSIGLKMEARVVDRAFLAHAGEHVLERPPVGRVIEHGVRGDEGDFCARRQLR